MSDEGVGASRAIVVSRARAWYGADPDFFKNAEIHLHVPSGAIPKDGPSAGVTIATALASEVTRRPARRHRNDRRNHAVGPRSAGRRDQRKGARRSARRHSRNHPAPAERKNVNEDLTAELRKELTIHLVQSVDEVLLLALLPDRKAPGNGPEIVVCSRGGAIEVQSSR